jgi:beta-fructofuranosidase
LVAPHNVNTGENPLPSNDNENHRMSWDNVSVSYVTPVTYTVTVVEGEGINNLTSEEKPKIDMSLDRRSISDDRESAYKTFYKPQSGFVGDPMPFYNSGDETYYLFFLYENGNKHPIYFSKTKNYATFEGFGEVLPPGDTGSQDEWIGTGSFIKMNDTYYCFYTGHNADLNPDEKVMIASTSDLNTSSWSKLSNSLEAPSGYDGNNFRDPIVYWDDTRSKYVLAVAGRKDDKAAIVRYQSVDFTDNFNNWVQIDSLVATTSEEPQTYEIQTDSNIPECPDIFKMGDKWYMVFSRINQDVHRKTFYRVADNPNGPWTKCGNHETFDGLWLYAAKTVSNGTNRYISGWASSGQTFNSSNELDWGGALITHKLAQQADGKLYPQIPDSVNSKFSKPVRYRDIKKTGNVSGSGDNFTISNGKVVFNRNISSVKIEMKIDASQAEKNFGVAFGAFENQEDAYRLTFDTTSDNQYNCTALFMYQRGTEYNFTPLIVPQDKIFNVKIIIEKSLCVMYINDNVAFTNRISNMEQNPWMIFAGEGTVKFFDIKISQIS